MILLEKTGRIFKKLLTHYTRNVWHGSATITNQTHKNALFTIFFFFFFKVNDTNLTPHIPKYSFLWHTSTNVMKVPTSQTWVPLGTNIGVPDFALV